MLDVAKSEGFRSGENPLTAIRDARVLPPVKKQVTHHDAMPWREVPAFCSDRATRSAMVSKALQFIILTAAHRSEVLEMTWQEVDFDARPWIVPASRMKGGVEHPVPLTSEMLAPLELCILAHCPPDPCAGMSREEKLTPTNRTRRRGMTGTP